LKHLAALCVQRGGGVRVKVKDARGKGAANVVDVAIRQSRNADYDERAALLDTDVGWNQTTAVRLRAKEAFALLPQRRVWKPCRWKFTNCLC